MLAQNCCVSTVPRGGVYSHDLFRSVPFRSVLGTSAIPERFASAFAILCMHVTPHHITFRCTFEQLFQEVAVVIDFLVHSIVLWHNFWCEVCMVRWLTVWLHGAQHLFFSDFCVSFTMSRNVT